MVFAVLQTEPAYSIPPPTMKQSFTLGAVSGITALALGFPIAAQFAGAQETGSSSPSDVVRYDKRAPLSQDDVRAMIDRDNTFLLHVDAMVAIHKEAIQNHRIALEAAADMTDETERNDAVRAAHEAMRREIEEAIEADPELADLKMMPLGPGGPGKGPHGHDGMMKFRMNLEEKLGMTAEELKTALDSGKTIHEIASGKGIELPERPAFTERR